MSLLFCRFQVLAELKEYATEVDVDFVRKAVRAIGRCAIKVEVQKKKKTYDLYAEVFSYTSQHKNLNLLQTCRELCHNNATQSLSDGNMFSCFASVWLLNS